MRRLFRIYPMLVVSVLISTTILLVLKLMPPSPYLPLRGPDYLLQTLSPVKFALNAIAWAAEVDPPLWSLKIELYYSFAFPLIYWIVRRPTGFAILGAISALAMFTPILGHSLTRYFLMAFTLGAVLPLYPSFGRNFGRIEAFAIPIYLVGLASARKILAPMGLDHGTFVFIETICSAALLRAVYYRTVPTLFLDNPILIDIGNWSYSIYLLHFPIMYLFCVVIGWIVGGKYVADHGFISEISLTILTAIVTIPLSALTYLTIEIPFQRIGKHLFSRKKDSIRGRVENA